MDFFNVKTKKKNDIKTRKRLAKLTTLKILNFCIKKKKKRPLTKLEGRPQTRKKKKVYFWYGMTNGNIKSIRKKQKNRPQK